MINNRMGNRVYRKLGFCFVLLSMAGCLTILSCAQADSKAAKAGAVLRFKRHAVMDRPDMIGGEAVSMLIPSGWEAEGGVAWRLHPTMPAGLAVRIFNPKGLEVFETFPAQPYSWGGMLAMTGFPEGSNYMGNEVRPPPVNAFEYLEQILIPRARPGVRFRVVDRKELPELAAAVRAQNAAQGGAFPSEVSAGKVRVEYEQNGKAVEEDFYCSLNKIFIPNANMAIWIADQLGAMKAGKGELDAQEKILQTIVASTQINLKWFNKYQQLVEALTAYQNRQIANAGVISKMISRTSDEISDMRRQSYEQNQAAMDRINEGYDQYVRGVDEYTNPDTGAHVELPSGYSHAWRGLNDEYVVTDNPNFNPNVELNGQWTALEPAGN
ncbi:MAG: hypothetical protein V2A34_04830 [Lentisphaerota bacterium]